MKSINRKQFIENYKELAKIYDDLEKQIKYYEYEKNRWKKKYFNSLNENKKMKDILKFCIINMKNEFNCTDKRTNKELHLMVEALEELL